MTIILDNYHKVFRVHSLEIVKVIAKELKESVSKLSAIEFVRGSLNIDFKEALIFVDKL